MSKIRTNKTHFAKITLKVNKNLFGFFKTKEKAWKCIYSSAWHKRINIPQNMIGYPPPSLNETIYSNINQINHGRGKERNQSNKPTHVQRVTNH